MSARFETIGLQAPDLRMLRAGIWEVPEGTTRRGVCVVLQGLTEFLEKYNEVADELVDRGFTVVSIDWRSQGGSERQVRGNRTGHVAHFDEYDYDLAVLLRQVVVPMQAPVIALAHSMGAHILLRYLNEHGRRMVCAGLIAPMLELRIDKFPPWYAHLITFLINLRRASPRMIFGTKERDPLMLRFEDNMVTSDRARFERNRALLEAQPFLRINAPSFGWLRAAFRSMRHIRRKRFAEEISTPLMIFGAGNDLVVNTAAIREYAKVLPNAEYVEIEAAKHEILMESDSIRARFWKEFDHFLELRLPTNRTETAP